MSDGRPNPSRVVKLLAAGAVLAAAGTYLAARIDFVRRHRPGIAPARYWAPQVLQIWFPGLGLALLLALLAYVIHRRSR